MLRPSWRPWHARCSRVPFVRFAVWWLGVLLGASSCGEPGYRYCVTVTDCSSGEPVADVRVRFEHEGLYDQHTDAIGRACASNIGAPGPHVVTIDLDKTSYRRLVAGRESKGDELDARLCVCKESDPTCRDSSEIDLDVGQDASSTARWEGGPT